MKRIMKEMVVPIPSSLVWFTSYLDFHFSCFFLSSNAFSTRVAISLWDSFNSLSNTSSIRTTRTSCARRTASVEAFVKLTWHWETDFDINWRDDSERVIMSLLAFIIIFVYKNYQRFFIVLRQHQCNLTVNGDICVLLRDCNLCHQRFQLLGESTDGSFVFALETSQFYCGSSEWFYGIKNVSDIRFGTFICWLIQKHDILVLQLFQYTHWKKKKWTKRVIINQNQALWPLVFLHFLGPVKKNIFRFLRMTMRVSGKTYPNNHKLKGEEGKLSIRRRRRQLIADALRPSFNG